MYGTTNLLTTPHHVMCMREEKRNKDDRVLNYLWMGKAKLGFRPSTKKSKKRTPKHDLLYCIVSYCIACMYAGGKHELKALRNRRFLPSQR